MDNEKFTRAINDNLMNIIFEKKMDNDTTQESFLLNQQRNLGIKVMSVALPSNKEFFGLRNELKFIDWMQNKVKNEYFAFHEINSKYCDESDKISWNNNKLQNQRFLETKRLYGCAN